MGEKDVVEKTMEDYPDVFADVVNALLFEGEQVVRPEELFEVGLRSQFKADTGREHEQERDVAKYWIRDGEVLALFGLENQTGADADMPMRIFAYDGSSYKSQLLTTEDASEGSAPAVQGARYPVITLVLYFGETRWGKGGRSLRKMFRGPEVLRRCVDMDDYHARIYEIAYLSDEQLKLFHSDFGFVVEYMVHKRKRKPLRLTLKREVRHVDAFLKMLSVFAGDEYVEKLSEDIARRKQRGERIMGYDLSKAMVEIGRKEGRIQGRQAEQEDMRKMVIRMAKDGKLEILEKAAESPELWEQLMKEQAENFAK